MTSTWHISLSSMVTLSSKCIQNTRREEMRREEGRAEGCIGMMVKDLPTGSSERNRERPNRELLELYFELVWSCRNSTGHRPWCRSMISSWSAKDTCHEKRVPYKCPWLLTFLPPSLPLKSTSVLTNFLMLPTWKLSGNLRKPHKGSFQCPFPSPARRIPLLIR